MGRLFNMFYQGQYKMKNGNIWEWCLISFLLTIISAQLYYTHIEMEKPYGLTKAIRE